MKSNEAGWTQPNANRQENVKLGPIKNRSCTDVICTALFLFFIAGYVLISIYAYKNGDPRLLLYPTDSEGNRCGLKTYGENGKDVENKPYLLFFDLSECFTSRLKNPMKTITSLDLTCPTPQICVETCPSTNSFFSTYTMTGSPPDWPCDYRVTEDQRRDPSKFERLVREKRCAGFTVKSGDLLKRCIPGEGSSQDLLRFVRRMIHAGIRKGDSDAVNDTTSTSSFKEALNSFLVDMLDIEGTMNKLMTDFSSSWPFIVVLLCIACAVCFLWILAMRWIAPPMVWFSLIAFTTIFAFGTYYCLNKYLNDPNIQDRELELTTNLQSMRSNRKTWMVLSIVSTASLVIVLLILIFLRNRVKIAIELMKESSKAVASIASTLLFPVLPFLLQLSLFSGWVSTMLFLASSTKPIFVVTNSSSLTEAAAQSRNDSSVLVVDGSVCDRKSFNDAFEDTGAVCQYSHDGPNPNDPLLGRLAVFAQSMTLAKVYLVFGLLWFMNFIVALGEMTLAGAFASWYWVFDKRRDVPSLPLLSSFWRCLRYHIGTLAFGSLIIAMVQFIRAILEYVDQKLKNNQDNEVAKFIMKCLKCLFWCLEKCLKFINRNAYIMTAVKGSNFCSSARKAFTLILENCVRAVVLDKVVDFLLFVGKATVVGGMGVLSFYYYSGHFNQLLPKRMEPEINFIYVPVAIIILATYMVSSGFFSVYAMAVDTLFLCFLEDIEMNDGSAEKPYYMSKNLMKILGKSNEKTEENSKCCNCF